MRRLAAIKPHLTYANVVASLALLIAISGGATAVAITAGKNSVTTKSIRNDAVTARKLGPVAIKSAEGPLQATARCAHQEQLLGGGATIDGSEGTLPALRKSQPSGNGWFALANQATSGMTVRAFAVCLKK